MNIASNNVSIDYGEDVDLTCRASVKKYPYLMNINVTVAWLKNGKSVKEIKAFDSLDNFPFTLSLKHVNGTSAGRYVCKMHVDNSVDSQKFEDNISVFLTGNIILKLVKILRHEVLGNLLGQRIEHCSRLPTILSIISEPSSEI